MKNLLIILFVLFNLSTLKAQTLDYETQVTILLEDGTSVLLYGKVKNRSQLKNNKFNYFFKNASLESSNAEYYYVPPANSARLSKNSDGVPEFMLLKFTTDAADAPQGGLLHLLAEWGLTAEQERELEEKLKKKLNKSNAKVMGTVPVQPYYDEESGAFEIVSGTLSDTKGEAAFTKSIVKGRAPTVQGGKSAVAARLDQYGATLLEKTFTGNTSVADLSFDFYYTYPIQVQAAQGKIEFDKERYQVVKDSLHKEFEYKKRGHWWWKKKERTYEETRNVYEELINTNVLKCEFIEGANIPEDKIKVVRDAFFNTFLTQFTTPSSELPESTINDLKNPGDEIDVTRESGKSSKYVLNVDIEKESRIESHDDLQLDWRMSIDFPLQIGGNAKSFYDEIKDNPQCIKSVNISDPFYERPEITAVLDVETRDVFKESINFVELAIQVDGKTPKVIKFNNDGKEFEFIKSITWGREEGIKDNNYRSKITWGIGGGGEIEGNWETKDNATIALVPPVRPRTINLRARKQQLLDAKIFNVVAEIRYKKFGKERQEFIDLLDGNNDMAGHKKTIFMDDSATSYSYRLIYQHEEHDDLSSSWMEKENGAIFASIPKGLMEQNQSTIKKMKGILSEWKEVSGIFKNVLNDIGGLRLEIKKLFNDGK